MDQNPKQQVVERIKGGTNILVTVSANPSVDQLAACIGFTLLLNKFEKHATAVFSGNVPSTLEFLQPEKTLETNTDSLQDFIIALDKSKADKLRYKVEDDVVRIFITPYRTSISEKDLQFSQGDFNVDVVVALGVTKKEDIDQAIAAHGRILHDAVVVSVTDGQNSSDIGAINWNDPTASSLCEMLVSISESFQSGLLDGQMSTAFLTGIVAETERFSNAKTSPKVMTMSAQLMAAGANQQLIATELATPEAEPEPAPQTATEQVDKWMAQDKPEEDKPNAPEPEPQPVPEPPKPDGEFSIVHGDKEEPEPEVDDNGEIHIDDQGNLQKQAEMEAEARKAKKQSEAREQAHVAPEDYIANAPKFTLDPLPDTEATTPSVSLPPVADDGTAEAAPASDTLSSLEVALDSPHVDDARAAVATANLDTMPRPAPTQAVGAQFMDMGNTTPSAIAPTMPEAVAPVVAPPVPSTFDPMVGNTPPVTAVPTMPTASTTSGVGDILQQTSSTIVQPTEPTVIDPMAPPPVPPPMMPPANFTPATEHHNPYLNPSDANQPPASAAETPPAV